MRPPRASPLLHSDPGPADEVNSTYNDAGAFEGLPLRIAVIGCGHVGLVTGICLASIGHHVTFVDRDTGTDAFARRRPSSPL
jgi:threonine dehydrogenase-like Zn-dependent dehydrogenase